MEQYSLRGDKFVLRDYDRLRPFSSFLPGLAGIRGIPMWSFYTNRGQAMASFGLHNKGNAMMEFSPANTMYETVELKGFRTFLKADGRYIEPFFRQNEEAARTMEIERNALTIIEERQGLRMTVRYFILPNEAIGALVRRVSIENTGGENREIEALDGLPQILPYGIDNSAYKEVSNLMRSWSDVVNQERRAPIFKMRASGDDSAEVREINGGWYYCAFSQGASLPIVYDRDLIFGSDLTLIEARGFLLESVEGLLGKEQVFANKVPCAFAVTRKTLAPGETLDITAYAGYAPSAEFLNARLERMGNPAFADRKLEEARAVANQLTADVRGHTADGLFDRYIEQSYLDNFLRGGYPFVFGEGTDRKVVHLFSRKHGDPERDYNFFSIAGEYYSQGNGNYRDVCQNRRLDVSLHPEVGDFNIRNFFSLVQMDGFNPLEIQPSAFTLSGRELEAAQKLLAEYVEEGGDPQPLARALEKPFTPGGLAKVISENGIEITGDKEEELITALLILAKQRFVARFGEGYWSDHFDYDLDLVEDYLSVWPDKKRELLFGCREYRYYDSVAVVRPRGETYVLGKNGPRQYGALRESEKKAARPGFDPKGGNWLRDRSGNPLTTDLFEKMLTLAVNKLALLDNEGLGVELVGGKPGWNDAMNGLPGLFGSSMAETLELRRLVAFLKEAAAEREPEETESFYREFLAFTENLYALFTEERDSFSRWDAVADERERFWLEIEEGASGERGELSFARLDAMLGAFLRKLDEAVARALKIGNGIMPTFFTYEATDYEALKRPDGSPVLSPYGLPSVRVKAFRRKDLPYFLEGPARYLSARGETERTAAADMAAKVRASELYDNELGMFKTSESLENESMEIGRVRAFTPGWLERESVFLHMEYKYLLGLLKAGLYEEFFRAFDTALIPHLNPEVYGRSILENSSFIASSVNPDPAVHGRGFQARLSGSCIEALAMWKGMFVGRGGFSVENGELRFRFAPVLPGSLFDEAGEVSFPLCGSCAVTYRNPARKDTFGENGATVRSLTLRLDGREQTVQGDMVSGELAKAIRERRVESVVADLG